MMKQKFFAALILGLAGFNQLDAQVKFGVKASFSCFNVTGKDANNNALNNRLLITYNAGVFADMPVATDFYLQPGLFLAQKGYMNKENNITTTGIIRYIEVPVNFLYKPEFGDGRLMLGFGPYFAYGVGGKMTQTPANGTTKDYDLKFKNTVTVQDQADGSKVYLKPFDAGANFLAGYEFNNGILFNLYASLGLTKINPSYDGRSNDHTSAKNTGFGLSVGYKF